MRRVVASLVMTLFAACGGRDLHNLPGEWVMMGDALEFPRACGSHGPISYEPNGNYVLWGEAGTWRQDGQHLTETMTGFDPMHVDRAASDIDKPVVSTLEWIDQDSFSKRYADGSVRMFRRCPDKG